MYIKVTDAENGNLVYVNTDKIIGFYSAGADTHLRIGNTCYLTVKESPESIMSLMLENARE